MTAQFTKRGSKWLVSCPPVDLIVVDDELDRCIGHACVERRDGTVLTVYLVSEVEPDVYEFENWIESDGYYLDHNGESYLGHFE